ncbi:(2Fe-2S)-binding protein [Streptomyces roseoverticillatus]|uniref:(2Fe-2S)-binding protein n=1 Tax=Streptomyces roseoverticillatus TaxID=66429 RepID=A0ABV3J2I9_9ACTN
MALMTVYVDGERHRALPGQTVAALLLATGRRSWRTTRLGGRPRGVFCGIGVCYDCLLVVNGLPDVRACLRELRDGDRVETLRGARLPAGAGPLEVPEAVRPVRDASDAPDADGTTDADEADEVA